MTRVARLAGSVIVETLEGGTNAWYLVGATKRPCDWAAAGFKRPEERDPKLIPFVPLEATGAPRLPPGALVLPENGIAVVATIADRLLIARTGSVSERLWRLIFGAEEDDAPELERDLEAPWFVSLPPHVWGAVQATVLKCS